MSIEPKGLVGVSELGSSGGNSSEVPRRVPPSLVQLCIDVMAGNVENISSLYLVPYFLRKKLSDRVCDKFKMNVDSLNLFLQLDARSRLLDESPTAVRVRNCMFISKADFHKSLMSCKTESLRAVQFDHLGWGVVFDAVLRDKLALSVNCFGMLAVLSLRNSGQTDTGVELIVNITSESVKYIADYLGKQLRELYIDGCKHIKTVQIGNEIQKLKVLEVCSVAIIEDVSDGFIERLVSVCGESLKDLDMGCCLELTDLSLKAVASHCPGLLRLNVSALPRVTDMGLEFLANGCRSIQRLHLFRTKFSDEAIAAFIQISGESLTELTLNQVYAAGPNTALSVARRSRYLSYLDISSCRRISTKDICLIVDNCLSLKFVKIIGCTQIDIQVLNGHSNCQMRVFTSANPPRQRIPNDSELLDPDHEVFLRYSPLPTPIDS